MPSYDQTHPWISFRFDFSPATPQLWLLLGEAQSKCEHIAGVPLRPNVAKELHQLYLAKGVLATTAIEGNTLSEEQVLKHIQGQLKLPPSQSYLAQEIDNIIEACNAITKVPRPEEMGISALQIKAFNFLILKDLQLEEGVVPGEYRTRSVLIGSTPRSKHKIGSRSHRGNHEFIASDCSRICRQIAPHASTRPFYFSGPRID
jgi:hypothetical protein